MIMKRILLYVWLFTASAEADEITLRVTGLFSKDRETDLRAAVEKIERVEIKKIDFETAKVTFEYEVGDEPFKPDTDVEKIRGAIESKIKGASNHTFGAIVPSVLLKDKLKKIEIGVVGLDCKGCAYATYRAIYQIEGVERATASFKNGKVTALIDPKKTNRAALEEALNKRGVTLAKEKPSP